MLAAAAVAAATLVGLAAAGARPAGAAPPRRPAVGGRQAGRTTVLPVADLLARHCDGTPIGGPTAAAMGSTAAWTGNCTLVLAAAGGQLTWFPGAASAIDGALVIRLADGTPPAPPAGGGDTGGGGGEVEWNSLSSVRATSLAMAVRVIDVGGEALVATSGPDGMTLAAAAAVDVRWNATLRAAAGPLSITAAGGVDLDGSATVAAAGGDVTVAAGGNLRVLPAAAVSGAGDVSLRAGENATLINASLSSGGVLTVAARRCLASGVSSSEPIVRVCE